MSWATIGAVVAIATVSGPGATRMTVAMTNAGTVAGRAAAGPDHEPLLGGVRPVTYLSQAVMEEAQRRYRERFEAGGEPTDP
ncbi:DUF6098 family protein [Nocardiopsis sp. RV163]|uniref:DUF6098 family protein n=1 Tax=Nocardiopsis sp. RV163 TaxID=1661388 RepID=UPI00373FD478